MTSNFAQVTSPWIPTGQPDGQNRTPRYGRAIACVSRGVTSFDLGPITSTAALDYGKSGIVAWLIDDL